MILLALGLQLWAFGFVAFTGSELLAAEPGLRVAVQVAWVAPVAAWAALRLRGPFSRLDWAILAALAALAFVSLMSVDVQGSLETLGLAIAYALAFWTMRAVGAVPRLRSATAVGVSYALTLWLVMAAVWWVGEKVDWITATGTIPSLESAQVFIWGTTNAFPIFVLLALPFIAWQRHGVGRSVLFVVWAVASVIVVPLSMGRAGWIGIAVAVLSLEPLSGWPVTRQVIGRLRDRSVPVMAAALAGVVVIVAAVVIGPSLVAQGTGGDRARIWSQALAIFGTDPLTGGGPGTYSWLRLAHVADYLYAVPVRLAHNVPLLTLADGGLILAAAFGALVVTFVVTAWRAAIDQRRRLALAALLGVGVASLLDDFSSLPALMACVVTLAAWTVAREEDAAVADDAADPRRWVLPGALAALAILALPAVVGVNAARLAAADARRAAVAGEWSVATERFADAVGAYGSTAGYWLGLGLSAWHAGDVGRATDAYAAAHLRNPYDARAAGALAALDAGSLASGELLDEAVRHDITDPQYSYRLGDRRWESGQEAAAIGAYGLAVAIAPPLIETFSVRGSASGPRRADVAAAALEHVRQLDELDGYVLRPEVAWDLGLAAGDLPDDAPDPWRAVDLARNGDTATALQLARDALGAEVSNPRALQALAAAARMACDPSAPALERLVGSRLPLRPTEVRDTRDHTYRDQSLGSYQPLAEDPYPPLLAWPWSLIGDPPDCP